MSRYVVNSQEGKKTTYVIFDSLLRKIIANTFSNFIHANQIVMCMNMYEDMKELGLLSDVLQKLEDLR